MNTRQRQVVLNVYSGMNQTKAYETVYGENSNSRFLASQLLTSPNVKAYLDSLIRRKEAITMAVSNENAIDYALTKAEKRKALAEILREGKPTTETTYNRKIEGRPGLTATMTRRDIIEAIREDNKMEGHYAPSKHLIAQKVVFEIEQVDKRKRGE